MNLTELVAGAALTLAATGTALAALDLPALEADARLVTDRASCRIAETAIVAFAADHDAPPVDIRQLGPYVDGDVSAYHLSNGTAAGPGCADPG